MINLTDNYGKTWRFKEKNVNGIFIDNPNPNHLVTLFVGPVIIETNIKELSTAIPQMTEDMELKI